MYRLTPNAIRELRMELDLLNKAYQGKLRVGLGDDDTKLTKLAVLVGFEFFYRTTHPRRGRVNIYQRRI